MKLLLLLAFTALCLTANSTTYYVAANGDDANNGTSASTPWRSINKINSTSFSPGDVILFRRGDMWREQLNLSSSGSAGNPITFSAFGTGEDPIINGADITTGWTRSSGNIWSVRNPNVTPSRATVVIDGVIYNEVASMGELNGANKYFINSGVLYVWSTADPNTRRAEVSKRDYCIVADAYKKVHHVNFDHLQAWYAGNAGLALYGTEGQQFPGYCIVDHCNFYGNRLHSCVAYDGHSNDIFRNSSATYNGNGFYAWGSDNLTISNCRTAHNTKHTVMPNFTDGHGYGAYRANNWIVENCVSDDDDDAIHTDAGSTPSNAIIRYNKIYNARPGSPGIGVGSLAAGAIIKIYYNLIVNASGEGFSTYTQNKGTIQFYNNTIYLDKNSGTTGLVYLGYGDNFDFKNNIFMRDGGNMKALFGIVRSGMPKSNYNLFYQSDPVASPIKFQNGQTNYRTLAEWSAATGQDKNSIDADPLFNNIGSDWSLKSGSPCINKGVDVGLTNDINGNPIVGLPDIGAYESGTTAAVVNKAPVAKAGSDVNLTLPNNSTTLNGSTSSDADGSIASYAWSKVSGPATFAVASATSASTDVDNLVEGTYVFRLTVKDDDGTSATDDVQIVVNPLPNHAPVARAGRDIETTLPADSVILNGRSSTDPDGAIVRYSWSKISGPSLFTILKPTSASTIVDDLTEGKYVFRLSVNDDDGSVSTDDITITVNPKLNEKPIAKAGTDSIIELPLDSFTLNGSASYDPDGSIVSFNWGQIDSLLGSHHPLTGPRIHLKHLKEGIYTFILTVRDNKNATDADSIRIRVINKFKKFGAVALYPNPTRDRLHVIVNDDEPGTVLFNIYDARGRKINSGVKVEKPEGFYHTSINVAGLGQGVYALETVINMRRRILTRFVRM